jgi:hypothetical protein
MESGVRSQNGRQKIALPTPGFFILTPDSCLLCLRQVFHFLEISISPMKPETRDRELGDQASVWDRSQCLISSF